MYECINEAKVAAAPRERPILRIYRTIRGTNKCESLHRLSNGLLTCKVSPPLAKALMDQFDFEVNIKAGIKNMGWTDFGTFNYAKLQFIHDLFLDHGWPSPLPGFELNSIPKDYKTDEKFTTHYLGIIPGVTAEDLAHASPNRAPLAPQRGPLDLEDGQCDTESEEREAEILFMDRLAAAAAAKASAEADDAEDDVEPLLDGLGSAQSPSPAPSSPAPAGTEVS